MRSCRKPFITVVLSTIILFYIYDLLFDLGDEGVTIQREIAFNDDENSIKIFMSSNKLNIEDEALFKSISQVNTKQSILNVQDESFSHRIYKDTISAPVTRPHDFRDCRMANCFDFNRCQIDGPIKVHIVPSREDNLSENRTQGESNLIHQQILKVLRNSEHYEPDASRACIFVLQDDTLDRDPLSLSFRSDLKDISGPHNQYGMNHLIFNLYSGSWPEYREDDFAGLNFGAAILAKASNSLSHHRNGFDISLPLFSYLQPYSNSELTQRENPRPVVSIDRKYFLTFKGKRYVFGNGSETRNSLHHLNNNRDVIMLTTCRHGKKWRESSDSRCKGDEVVYDQYDFKALMEDSKFCLTPRGRRLGSFRYLEAMSNGCVPVVLSNSYVKPFNEIIDWSCVVVQFDEKLLLQVPEMLRELDAKTIEAMRDNCLKIYNKYFSTINKIVLTTLSIIERRIKNVSNSSESFKSGTLKTKL